MRTFIYFGLATWLLILSAETFDAWVYVFTRFAVFAAVIFYCSFAGKARPMTAWAMGLAGLLFNPFIPLRLGREIWQIVDTAAAGVFIVAALSMRTTTSGNKRRGVVIDTEIITSQPVDRNSNGFAGLGPPPVSLQRLPAPPTSAPESIEILPEYSRVLDAIRDGCPAIFVTGRAGTGKSTMIRFILERIPNSAVVAPTGLAALNVGGTTIHSFFTFPPRPLDTDTDYPVSRRMAPVFQNLGVLIVDEVSMVKPDMVDCMDASLRKVRRNNLPFGGVPVVFVGDLHQLPPVVSTADEAYFYSHRYRSEFFFDADIFREVEMIPVGLTRVFRQADADFVQLLERVRKGKHLDATVQTLNQACHHSPQNSNVHSLFLVPTNNAAFEINTRELNALRTPLHSFDAIIKGEFKPGEDRSPAPDKLEIKVGARVLFVKNNRPFWVNGTLGEVVDISAEIIRVRIGSSESVVSVQRATWEQLRNRYDPIERNLKSDVVGSFTQFPLRLGWALTIHKSQGMTLDSVRIDIGNGAFAAGQTYVALSRCKTLEGITLDTELIPKDIIVSEVVSGFYRALHDRVKRASGKA